MQEGDIKLQKTFDLPKNSIYNGGIAVCQYLNADGEMEFGYVYDTTELPLSSTLGLLELAKQHLYKISNEDEEV